MLQTDSIKRGPACTPFKTASRHKKKLHASPHKSVDKKMQAVQAVQFFVRILPQKEAFKRDSLVHVCFPSYVSTKYLSIHE